MGVRLSRSLAERFGLLLISIIWNFPPAFIVVKIGIAAAEFQRSQVKPQVYISALVWLVRRKAMRHMAGFICILGMLVGAAYGAGSNPASATQNSIVITFKDGHQQSFSLADIERIEFKTPAASVSALGRNHFVGKWRVGEGNGEDFYITLEPSGEAKKSIGAVHGTWEVVNGEAEISWDDGWHDAIRKVGTKHEKFAFEPGKSFSDSPSNVTNATNTQPNPI